MHQRGLAAECLTTECRKAPQHLKAAVMHGDRVSNRLALFYWSNVLLNQILAWFGTAELNGSSTVELKAVSHTVTCGQCDSEDRD